jgi:hypothetical protein
MKNNDKILQTFLGGKSKARIVKLFLHHPNLSISIEGISKRVGIKNHECAGIIKDLSRSGFLLDVKQNYGKAKKKAKK